MSNQVIHDPLWPSEADTENAVDAMKEAIVVVADTWKCEKCGTFDVAQRAVADETVCNKCYTNEAANNALAKKTNSNWMEQAVACGLALFERQPEESDEEWRIWNKYRDHYPMKMPTWTELANECNVSTATALRVANKWSFKVRIQHWARSVDDSLQERRAEDIKEMNDRQVTMAKTLQEKLKAAIDDLNPALLRPMEIVQLMKASTDLERRIALSMPEKVDGTALDTGTKQQALTKPEDIGEVIGILLAAGAIDGKTLGFKTTTTTEIVAKGD